MWHVHGSWTTSFVQGRHEVVLPVLPDRGPDGRGRATTWDWPDRVVELPPEQLADAGIDVVLLQRPQEFDLAAQWLRRRPGADVPAVYVEHDLPRREVPYLPHHVADRPDVTLVHVTHVGAALWDNGRARTRVIEHGIVDPGARWTGELDRAAVVVNEPVRRARLAGTDLLPRLIPADVGLDLFGMQASAARELPWWPAGNGTFDDLPQDRLHAQLGKRRVYVHPYRWTSLGLSLLEAMHLGMPIVALGASETWRAVPAEAGLVSSDPDECRAAVRYFAHEHEAAAVAGKAARAAALERYGLERFLTRWDQLLLEVTQ